MKIELKNWNGVVIPLPCKGNKGHSQCCFIAKCISLLLGIHLQMCCPFGWDGRLFSTESCEDKHAESALCHMHHGRVSGVFSKPRQTFCHTISFINLIPTVFTKNSNKWNTSICVLCRMSIQYLMWDVPRFSSPVFVFPCAAGHTMCLDCFQAYCIIKLNNRSFIYREEIGYTVECPGNYT